MSDLHLFVFGADLAILSQRFCRAGSRLRKVWRIFDNCDVTMCVAMTGYLWASSVMSANMFSSASERAGGGGRISSCDWRASSRGRSGWRGLAGSVTWGLLTATSYSTNNWAWGTCAVMWVGASKEARDWVRRYLTQIFSSRWSWTTL
jgi:hypothetical protein